MASERRKHADTEDLDLPTQLVESRIHVIRGEKVPPDEVLAELYGVETRVRSQAVSRNRDRFPEDFAFRLSWQEFTDLRSQTVTSSWGGRRKPLYAFTEQGVAMPSSGFAS